MHDSAALVEDVRRDPQCQGASAFAVVRQMLEQLGWEEDMLDGLLREGVEELDVEYGDGL